MSGSDIGRDVELRVKGHLYEIGQLNDEIIEGRTGYHMSEIGYEKTLQSVAECASVDEIDDVAAYIKSEMERWGERPENRKVRRKAREIVTEAGVPASKYLNRA